MREHDHPSQVEIGPDGQQRFVDKIREVAPYNDQPIDSFGSFETRFGYEGDEVSVRIPVATDELIEDEFLDDAYRVLRRHEEPEENGHIIVKVVHYIVYPAEQRAAYLEDILVFDTGTGERVVPARPNMADLKSMTELIDFNRKVNPPVFTEAHLRDVLRLLDNLEPPIEE